MDCRISTSFKCDRYSRRAAQPSQSSSGKRRNPARRTVAPVLAALLLVAAAIYAQQIPRVTVSGRVLDDSTLVPLENVNVFIAQTTIGTNTDRDGRFQIQNLPVGSYQLVASRIGYAHGSLRTMLTESGTREFEIRLRPAVVQMGEVLVRGTEPVEWKRQLERFTGLFLGRTQNAKECRIMNAEVLEFKEIAFYFEASARAPIEVENRALGYHVQFFLTTFKLKPEISAVPTSSPPPAVITLEGLAKYTELEPSTQRDKKRWEEDRRRAYKGSARHFFASLFERQLRKEGFIIYRVPEIPAGRRGPQRERIKEDDILRDGLQPHERVVRFSGFLEVEYIHEPIEQSYDGRRRQGTDSQISWFTLNYESITINSRGLILELLPVTTYGYWAWDRMADELPLDYNPEVD